MKKINPPKLVTVAVFTTITIIFWIFFGVYNVLTSDVDIDVDKNLLKPINTNLDTQVLNEIQRKKYYDSSFQVSVFNNIIQDNETSESSTPDPEEAVEIEASESDLEDEVVEGVDENPDEVIDESTNTSEEETL